MPRQLALHEVEGGAGAVCAEVLATIPHWFGIEESNADYVAKADLWPGIVASVDGEDVGLLTVCRHSPATAEIYLLAVKAAHHREGIGRQLVERLEAGLAADGTRFLQVKTLSSSAQDEGYAKTRRFYDAQGFVVFEEMPLLWDPSNPAVILVKSVGGAEPPT